MKRRQRMVSEAILSAMGWQSEETTRGNFVVRDSSGEFAWFGPSEWPNLYNPEVFSVTWRAAQWAAQQPELGKEFMHFSADAVYLTLHTNGDLFLLQKHLVDEMYHRMVKEGLIKAVS